MTEHVKDPELDRWLSHPDTDLLDDEAFVQRVMAALPAPARNTSPAAQHRLLPHLQALALGCLLALLLALWPDQALALSSGGSAAVEAGLLGLCGLGLLAWWSLPQAWASPWR